GRLDEVAGHAADMEERSEKKIHLKRTRASARIWLAITQRAKGDERAASRSFHRGMHHLKTGGTRFSPPNYRQLVDFDQEPNLRFSPDSPPDHGGESWHGPNSPSANASAASKTHASTAASVTCSSTSSSWPFVPLSPGPTPGLTWPPSPAAARTG